MIVASSTQCVDLTRHTWASAGAGTGADEMEMEMKKADKIFDFWSTAFDGVVKIVVLLISIDNEEKDEDISLQMF